MIFLFSDYISEPEISAYFPYSEPNWKVRKKQEASHQPKQSSPLTYWVGM